MSRSTVALVVTGRPNKQIAYQLKLSEMTVKAHRSQIMRKMRAKSLVDLVRMADRLGVSAENPEPPGGRAEANLNQSTSRLVRWVDLRPPYVRMSPTPVSAISTCAQWRRCAARR
jgi:DNA-binding CsgD family transcriptional regulator